MRVEPATSWDVYLPAWTCCMSDVHWFSEEHLLDYSREEETEELEGAFRGEGNLFLMAVDDGGSCLGVLGIRVQGELGTLRRWEPAVPALHRNLGVGEALLKRGLEKARIMGVTRVCTILKYPYGSPLPWNGRLYERHGFSRTKSGVNLVMDLEGDSEREPSESFETAPCDDYSIDEAVDFVLRAFASEAEDREIHGGDETVSDPEGVRRIIGMEKQGRFGRTSQTLKRVALSDGEPAGFIKSFIREEKYLPDFGLIGILGVFPEYRRQGIGYYLIDHALAQFRGEGLRYAYVGTSDRNYKALRAYEKAGFRPLFRQINYEKNLT